MRLAGDGIEVEVPAGWEQLELEDVFAIGKSDGVGAMQISAAPGANAELERPTIGDLREIIAELAAEDGLGAPVEASYFEVDRLRAAEASFHHSGDFIRIWSVTDGKGFALATYVCRLGSEKMEAEACDGIVRSLRFSAPTVMA